MNGQDMAICGLLNVTIARIERAEFAEAVGTLARLIEQLGGEVMQ